LIDFVTVVTNAGPAAIDGFLVRIPYTSGTTRVHTTTTSGFCDYDLCYIATLV
jgi:hypothetical protein